MSGIVWLASYPKSGNTWVRVILSNLLRGAEGPASINALQPTPIASGRRLFDDRMGIAASDLTPREIERLRPRLYEDIAHETPGTPFLKVHDARWMVDGQPMFPASCTAGVIYIVRDPRDVAVSFAHHMNVTVDVSIKRMAKADFSLATTNRHLAVQLQQRLSTWSGHMESWLDHDEFPRHVIRYEDLHSHPSETVSRMARFAGIAADAVTVERAVEFSSFTEVRDQEEEQGFRERPPKAGRFFREGRAGGWKGVLSIPQAAAIARDHGPAMERFGYGADERPEETNHASSA